MVKYFITFKTQTKIRLQSKADPDQSMRMHMFWIRTYIYTD